MHSTNETLRKSLHVGFGLFAFTLKWLPWWGAALVAAVAIVHNRFLLHRLFGRDVAREARGYDAGIVLYPIAVLTLILLFRDRLHYAAIAWVLMAFGDGFATLAGKRVPIAPLPWNRKKSWGGFLTFIAAGLTASAAVSIWMGYHAPAVILLATLAAAIAESLPLGIDDNIAVPFAASVAVVIAGIEVTSAFSVWPNTPAWLVVNALLAIAGYLARSVSFSGALGGWILGAIIILGAGWPMYVSLLAFFILGSATTKLGYSRKAKSGLAQEEGGRRGFSHAFSNVGVAAICAIAVSRVSRALQPEFIELELIPMLMGIASLATAAADTTASEIGQLIGRRAFLPLTFRRVPVGTEGAISVEGTMAGGVAGFIVSLAGALAVDALFFEDFFRWSIVAALTVSAVAGSWIESVAGSWNRKHDRQIPNGVLNFFNTAVGALLFLALERTLASLGVLLVGAPRVM